MSSWRGELNKWLFRCNLNVVSGGTNARRQKQCPGGADDLLNDSCSSTQRTGMKDDHQPDFINGRQESFKWHFTFLPPQFYSKTEPMLSLEISTEAPWAGVPCGMGSSSCQSSCWALAGKPASVVFKQLQLSGGSSLSLVSKPQALSSLTYPVLAPDHLSSPPLS